MDSDQKKISKFLGVEHADGIKTKKVYNRIKEEVNKRLQMLIKTEWNDKSLLNAISSNMIPVAAYPINVSKFTEAETNELNLVVKIELSEFNMLEKQSSDKRLCLKEDVGKRGLKLLWDHIAETILRLSSSMVKSSNKWTKGSMEKRITNEN